MSEDEPPKPVKPTLRPIGERIEELKAEGKINKEIVNILYTDGYNTKLIMEQGFSLRSLKPQKPKVMGDEDIQKILAGGGGGAKQPGYLVEWKELIRRQMSRSRQLTEVFYDLGLTILLASLAKSGLKTEEFNKIFTKEGEMRDALLNASQTAFKALDYFEADAMLKLEAERDEARAYATLLESEAIKLNEQLDPKFRLEKMIYNIVMMSGTTPIDMNALMALINKWMQLEISLPTMIQRLI